MGKSTKVDAGSVFLKKIENYLVKLVYQTKYGFKALLHLEKKNLVVFVLGLSLAGIWAYKNTPYKWVVDLTEKYLKEDIHIIEVFMAKIPFVYEFSFYVFVVILFSLLRLGKKAFGLEQSILKSFKTARIVNGEKKHPNLISLKQLSQERYHVKVDSNGIDLDTFRSKTKGIRAMTGLEVEEVLEDKNDIRKLDIYFNKYPLTQMLKYSEVCNEAMNPGDFVVGKTTTRLMVQNIADYPHMLVAGSSGNGKSYFLRQLVVNHLENTPNLQVYVFDFKNGVSFKQFRNLPNVCLYTSIHESNEILGLLEKEMKERFVLLKDGDEEEIDLKKHKKDPILIVVDECSMLYKPSTIDATKRQISMKATDITEKISKLSRAAKFHLILGSQKITKDTVNTHIQENLEGRVCFKVASVSGSSLVVGNKAAVDIPAIKGRAIYKFGTTFTELQTPFLDTSEIKERLAVIDEDYRSGRRKLMQPMLDNKVDESEKKKKSLTKTADKVEITEE